MTKYTKEDSDGITELCSGPFYMKKKYPIEAFESNIMVPFEDTKMPIPVGYDAYLKTAFWRLYDTTSNRETGCTPRRFIT